MIGIVLAILIMIGLGTGFTAISYPLVLVGLALCALDGLHPAFVLVLAPLALVHHVRMQNFFTTPLVFQRFGLVPVFGVSSLVLVLVIGVRLVAG